MAYKILVVDDDLAILRLIKKVLEYEKYEVVIRNKIEETMDRYKNNSY